MAKKKKRKTRSKNVVDAMTDVDYMNRLGTKPTVRLKNGEMVSEREYMQRFLNESYATVAKGQNTILETEEQIKWANRNKNMLQRDAAYVMNSRNPISDMAWSEYNRYYSNKTTETIEPNLKTIEQEFKEVCIDICRSLGLEYSFSRVKLLIGAYFKIKRLLSEIKKGKQNAIKPA
jgi:hypothetical protein